MEMRFGILYNADGATYHILIQLDRAAVEPITSECERGHRIIYGPSIERGN
jgi:hypothetical protein